MASMFSNVLGYLCPKSQENDGSGSRRSSAAVPDTGRRAPNADQENDDGGLSYGIEDVQDDWQIVRKMDAASGAELEDALDDGSGEALFALEEDASSAARRASLYRSAPPLIMEENLSGRGSPHRVVSPIRELPQPYRSPTRAVDATTRTVDQQPLANTQRFTHAKRKRRVRAQRHCASALAQSTNQAPTAPAHNPAPTTSRELGVRTANEEDKQTQNEDKELRDAKKLLARGQLQRGNGLPEVTGPKKRANRDGNYRCLH